MGLVIGRIFSDIDVKLVFNSMSNVTLVILSKMADAAAARREARRRKILENSGNRLQLISGKPEESPKITPSSSVGSIRPICEPEHEIPVTSTSSSSFKTPLPNGVFQVQPETTQLIPSTLTNYDIDASGSGDGELTSGLPPLVHLIPSSEPPISKPTVPLWERIINHKYDLVLLSLIIQTFNGMSLITFDTNGYIFLPVIIYIVTKLVWLPQQSNSTIANVLLLLNGMTQSRVHKIVFLTQTLSIVTCDIFVYLFTTICIQSLFVTLQDVLT